MLVGNYRDNKGDIYVILDGKFEKISLPHENIYYFQLTKDNIYYSAITPHTIPTYMALILMDVSCMNMAAAKYMLLTEKQEAVQMKCFITITNCR